MLLKNWQDLACFITGLPSVLGRQKVTEADTKRVIVANRKEILSSTDFLFAEIQKFVPITTFKKSTEQDATVGLLVRMIKRKLRPNLLDY